MYSIEEVMQQTVILFSPFLNDRVKITAASVSNTGQHKFFLNLKNTDELNRIRTIVSNQDLIQNKHTDQP